MTDDLVKRLLDGCRDIETGKPLYPGRFAAVTVEDAAAAAGTIERVLRERDEARQWVEDVKNVQENANAEGYAEARAHFEPRIASLEAENGRMREALLDARESIIRLKNQRWSEVEGSDAEWVAEIDAALGGSNE